MTRSEQLLQLAAQLASLATLEEAVAHGVQTSLDVPCPRLRFPPWVMPLAVRSCVSVRARAPLRKPLPIVLVAPFCSVSGVARGCLLRAVLRLRLTALSPPTAALAPLPPPRPCSAPWLLTPVRLPPSQQVRAPPRLGDASGTSTAGAATPSGRCGVRFSVKPVPPRALVFISLGGITQPRSWKML